jgi:hypothetical protein
VSRWTDAHAIQQGACNPIAITGALVKAIQEIRDEGGDMPAIRRDRAVQAILHQLAFLCDVNGFDRAYSDAMAEVEAKAKQRDTATREGDR